MTMPHLMNCMHSDEGWCLACVKEEHESNGRRIEVLGEACKASLEVLCGQMDGHEFGDDEVEPWLAKRLRSAIAQAEASSNAIDRVEAWILESDSIQRMLEYSGGAVVLQACESMSLRELARRTGLSPTYLSQVKNGHATISPKAFVLVSRQVQCR